VAAEAQQAATIAEPRQLATAVEPQQAASVTAATPAVAVVAPPTSPAPAAAGSPRAVVVEIPDDDVPPPGWDQWESPPASAPEPRRGCSWPGATSAQRWGAQRTALGPRRRALDSRRARSRGESMLTPRRPTLSTPKRSRGCGRSSVTTALH
jgi:hypothetical protein